MKKALMAMILALAATGASQADESKKVDATKPAPSAEPSEPALLPGGADVKRLKSILEGMGYDVKESKNNKGATFLHFTLPAAGFDFHPSLVLSPNRGLVWINVPIRIPKDIPNEVLVKMLEANGAMSPYLFKKSGEFWYLSGGQLNKDTTPKALREFIENAAWYLKHHEGLWNDKKWPATKVSSK